MDIIKQERLFKIANLIKKNSIVVDIGTDHGLLPKFLLENKISKKTVGVDISEKCLKKYIDLTKEEGSRAVACISNGLEKVKPFEADTLTVCGMGGNLICEILSNHLDKAKSFNQIILQANNGIYELRKFLFENGFYIENEIDLFEKDIYYQILDVREGPDFYNYDFEFVYGKVLIKNKSENLYRYLNQEFEKNESVKNFLLMKENKTENIINRLNLLENKLEEIEKVRKLIEN